MVASILSRDDSLNSAVIRNNKDRVQQGLDPASMNTSAYSDARGRLELGVVLQAAAQIAYETDLRLTLDEFWGILIPFIIDGSTATANDTPANQEVFPQHGMQQEGIGFPILRLEILQSLKSGMIRGAAFGSYKGKETGEMALARQLFPVLEKNSLLIGDRYFPSYFVMAELIKRGAHGVFQSHAARDLDFRHGQQLDTLDHIVEWIKPQKPSWMTQEEYDHYEQKISVREVDISTEINKGERFVIVTTLMDNNNFSKLKLSEIYKHRWKIESALKDIKDTFNMGHIDAKSPEMIEKVFWAHLLSYNILRWHILNAAVLYETTIDKVSVKTASTIMTENGGLILSTPKEGLPKLFADLYYQMTQVPVGMRPGRAEPRVVKKRPKPFPRMQEKRSDWHAKRNI